MNTTQAVFSKSAVQPMQCFKLGWNLIRDQYWMLVGVTFIGILIGSLVPMGIVMGPMMCGIYLCLFRKMRGEKASFDLLFKGFDFFAESLIATLIMIVPMIALLVPVYIAMIGAAIMFSPSGKCPADPAHLLQGVIPVLVLVMLFFLIFVLAVCMLFIFAYPLIVDRKMSGINAIKTSSRAAWANRGGLTGLLLANMALGLAGMCCCYIGTIFAMPVSFAALAIAYRQVFGEETATITADTQVQQP